MLTVHRTGLPVAFAFLIQPGMIWRFACAILAACTMALDAWGSSARISLEPASHAGAGAACDTAHTDMREWQIKRCKRTKQLIGLGGLVVKAKLVELTDDDRATLFGAFLTVAIKLRSEDREQALAVWERKGIRAFEDHISTPASTD